MHILTPKTNTNNIVNQKSDLFIFFSFMDDAFVVLPNNNSLTNSKLQIFSPMFSPNVLSFYF